MALTRLGTRNARILAVMPSSPSSSPWIELLMRLGTRVYLMLPWEFFINSEAYYLDAYILGHLNLSSIYFFKKNCFIYVHVFLPACVYVFHMYVRDPGDEGC